MLGVERAGRPGIRSHCGTRHPNRKGVSPSSLRSHRGETCRRAHAKPMSLTWLKDRRERRPASRSPWSSRCVGRRGTGWHGAFRGFRCHSSSSSCRSRWVAHSTRSQCRRMGAPNSVELGRRPRLGLGARLGLAGFVSREEIVGRGSGPPRSLLCDLPASP